eukprot:CAMPEP_0177304440 /NCGR_PEP_ID=MMETSP0368-20130122/6652_1 /TAXON_ID=447022 ORGANISM="Scrippsiella hangoei-like, Strain SHHI-4" /NCGR_SAMPLE_ID=MMETSP0368 /ASSEMBLY_ACC=CAM_ASM_000363 /LENGTH=74 /DNA_ID=CAMNT_0018763023 /DNA_START=27 /DNA_END=252 /DNA_ORIENTATION=-
MCAFNKNLRYTQVYIVHEVSTAHYPTQNESRQQRGLPFKVNEGQRSLAPSDAASSHAEWKKCGALCAWRQVEKP